MAKIPNDTRVLVVDGGMWYSEYQGIENPLELYIETLALLKPIFQRYIEQGIIVVWVPIPPLIVPPGSEWKLYQYGAIRYAAQNEAAKEAFQPIGVLIIDNLYKIMEARKRHDEHVTKDGVH